MLVRYFLELIWFDSGSGGLKLARSISKLINTRIEVIKPNKKEWVVLSRSWVVERTFAWLIKNRRLVFDCEQLSETIEAIIYAAMVRLMLRRLVLQRDAN